MNRKRNRKLGKQDKEIQPREVDFFFEYDPAFHELDTGVRSASRQPAETTPRILGGEVHCDRQSDRRNSLEKGA